MALNYECQECERRWPYAGNFSVCKVCRVPCRCSQIGEPMTQEQARYELKAIQFNQFYADREARRTGPSPEDIGRAEAQTLISLDRAASNG